MEQIAKGHFLMVGNGDNRKSMAYVGNVAAFLMHSLSLETGRHIFNYVDKPDFSMNDLVTLIKRRTGKEISSFRLPKIIGLGAGAMLDIVARATNKKLPISRVRVEKFCATTIFKADRVKETGFIAPTELEKALIETIDSEFLNGRAQAAE